MGVFLIYKDKPSGYDDSWWLWDKMIAISPTFETAKSWIVEREISPKDGQTAEWQTEDGETRLVHRNDGEKWSWYWSEYYIKEIDLSDSVVVVMERE